MQGTDEAQSQLTAQRGADRSVPLIFTSVQPRDRNLRGWVMRG